jgi:hypothetical protein
MGKIISAGKRQKGILREYQKNHVRNVQFLPLRATTFDDRTNISTMNIADDGNSHTCKWEYGTIN